jgi:hypothetical protein
MKNINKDGTQLDTMEDIHQSVEEEQTNIVPLKAIAGGGSGEFYWLLDLEAGAHFLCKVKLARAEKEQFELKEFWIVGIGERARQLELVLADGTSIRTWVDPIQFSKDMLLYELLER